MTDHRVVSHEEWLEARKALLAEEKAFDAKRDALAAKRRSMPWEKVEKAYVFQGPGSEQSLADLFGTNKQLII